MKTLALTLLLVAQFSFASELCITPESVGAVLLTDTSSIPAEYIKYQTMVIADLKKSNDSPSDFYVKIVKENEKINFELWHKSAFYPKNCRDIGNPGGLCRTIVIKNGKIISRLWWQ